MNVVSLPHQTSDDLSKSANVIPNNNNTSMSRTIIQQPSSSNPHPVRFNQELLHNFGINMPTSRQPDGRELPISSSSISTSLIPLPSSLSNNLGINNIHHVNQASITPTRIGTYPMNQSSLNNNYISSQTNFDNHHHLHRIKYRRKDKFQSMNSKIGFLENYDEKILSIS